MYVPRFLKSSALRTASRKGVFGASRSFTSPSFVPASSWEECKARIDSVNADLPPEEQIDTVIYAFPDVYGRLMGKRLDLSYYNGGVTNVCDYLLGTNVDMEPIEGLKFANWDRGYGDMVLRPDFGTFRETCWSPRSALLFGDLHYMDTHVPEGAKDSLISLAPRSMLQRAVDQLNAEFNYSAVMASELEFYMYEGNYNELRDKGYRVSKMSSVCPYVEDYHVLGTAREEPYVGAMRRALREAGVRIVGSKGEAAAGQHELNTLHGDPLKVCDEHTMFKQCLKEVGDNMGVGVTFMAKPYHTTTGSGCHVHINLVDNSTGSNAFVGSTEQSWNSRPNGESFSLNASPAFGHFLEGLLNHLPDFMPFVAPTINSYKRFVKGSWAPNRVAWDVENRTAAFRVVGYNGPDESKNKQMRIEVRVPGADVNPYLLTTGILHAGMYGMRHELELQAPYCGNLYEANDCETMPNEYLEGVRKFEGSDVVRGALGDDVTDHYVALYTHEWDRFFACVTDWERENYFEQI